MEPFLSKMSNLTNFDRVPCGYPKLGALVTKDKEYAVFRKFRWLNTRILLYLQSELTTLELRLKEVGLELENAGQQNTLSSYPEFVEDDQRRLLIEKIQSVLERYSE